MPWSICCTTKLTDRSGALHGTFTVQHMLEASSIKYTLHYFVHLSIYASLTIRHLCTVVHADGAQQHVMLMVGCRLQIAASAEQTC